MPTKASSSDNRGYPTYHAITSRGCLYACAYCCNRSLNKMWPDQKAIRKRSIGNVIQELIAAKETLPFIGCILINDDNFFCRDEGELADFSEQYKEHVRLPLWVTGLHVREFNEKKLSLLIDAGLKFIRTGIQTGSDQTKKLYRRNYSNQKVETVAKAINGFRDRIEPPSYDIILDNPWESDADLVKTLTLLSKLPRPYCLDLFSLTFYPNTELYSRAVKDGIIKDDLKDVYNKHYYSIEPTYLNKLFQLVDMYSHHQKYISPAFMSLLTNPRLRRVKLSHAIYHILKMRLVWLQMKRLLQWGIKDVSSGDWSRVFRFMATRFAVFR